MNRGAPYQNCTIGISRWVDRHFPPWAGMFFIFSFAMLCGLIASFYICCKKGKNLHIFYLNKLLILFYIDDKSWFGRKDYI